MKISKTSVLLVSLILIVLFIIILPSRFKNSLLGNDSPTKVTLNEVNKNIRPTQGEILSISEQRVEFKDSYLISLVSSDGENTIYVNKDTQIKASSGAPLEFSALEEGLTVVVIGEPAEGGVEAKELILLGI